MKSKAKVVVVGGGVVGVSALYHLAKKGWSDVVLVERKELTSGSTWHAAGLLPLFNMSYSVGQLHKYAVNLYKKLEEETGKSRNLRMKSKAKVVVVGGGVVGVSALYHLAKKGWSDVVLVERKELTSGSTWHAAGLLPLFNMSYSVGQLHKYAVNLYKKLEEETGKNVGFSVVIQLVNFISMQSTFTKN